MPVHPTGRAACYGAGVLAAAAAVGARVLLDPVLHERLPFASVLVAVVAVAWYCGRGPALAAQAVGSAGVAFFVMDPAFAFTRPEYQVGLAFSTALGAGIGVLIASLRAARAAAVERGDWLRVTLASIGDGVIATDAGGRVSFLNPVAAALTGWTPDEARGRPLTEVFRIADEDTREGVENPALRALREGRVVGLANHTVLLARDGAERPIDDTAAPIRDAGGAVRGAVLVFRDVTDRKRAEEERRGAGDRLADAHRRLEESHALLDTLMTKAPVGLAFVDREFRYRRVNETLAAIDGRPAGDFPGRTVAEVVPHLWGRLEPHYRRARDAGEAVVDVPVRGPAAGGGDDRHYQVSYYPVRAAGGGVAGVGVVVVDVTEVRRAEGRTRAVLESITDAFFTLGRDWRFTYVNREAERLLGRDRDDLIGKSIWGEYPPTLGTPFEANYTRALAENVPVTFEEYYPPHDRWYEVHVYPSADGLAVYFRNATDRHRADDALRASEARFRELADAMPQVVYVAGPDGTPEFVNRRWREYTGLDGPAALDFARAVHPDDLPGLLARWGAARAAGEGFEGEFRLRRADGAHRWFLTRSVSVRDADGRAAKWYGTSTDVDDLKRAEEQLRDARSRLEAALDASAVATWSWDIPADRVAADRNLAALFGVSPADAAGGPLASYTRAIHPDDLPGVAAVIGRAVEAGGVYEKEYRVVKADGSVRWVIARGRVETDAAGRAARMPGVVVDVTDRRAAEDERRKLLDELEVERGRLRAVVENVPAGLLLADAPSGRVTLCNPRVEEILRHPVVHTAGVEDYDQWVGFHPDGRRVEGREWPLARAVRGEVVGGEEYLYRRGDGTTAWVRVSGAPVRDAAGGVVGGVVAFYDVDSERRTEEALKESEARLREENRLVETLYALGTRLAAELDLSKLLQAVTDESVALTGAAFGAFFYNSTDEAGGTFLLSALSGAPREAFADFPHPRATAVFEPTFKGEGTVRLADVTADPRYGRNAPFAGMPAGHLAVRGYLAVSVRSRSGEVLGGLFFGHPEVGVFTPRHERLVEGVAAQAAVAIDNARLFEEARRERGRAGRGERDARFLADASAALAALVGDESTLRTVARLAVPGFADWCAVDVVDDAGGLRRVAVAHVDPGKVELAHELHRRFPPDPRAPTGAAAVARTGRPELVPDITDDMLAAVADAGYRRSLQDLGLRSYMGVPLSAHGRVFGVVTFIAAESGRRYGPDDLAVAEDLAHRAAVALDNARLYRALQEADRRKDEFLAMLAHELRNPLAPVRNGLHILKLRADPATVGRTADMMARQVDHLVRLVDDLMDVSRLVRGKVELRKEPVDLAAVVARAVETTQPAVDAAGQELTVALPGGPVVVEGDVVRLTQVLSNLLVNACKYSDRAGHIRVTAAREGGEAVVRVADTGVGIAAENLSLIFELFAQVDRSAARTQGGLGIGLTLVKRLVEMHGGTVTARSDGPDLGSEFTVRLPLLVERGGRTGEGGEDGSGPPSALPPPPSGRRVLVVDDNVDAAESLAALLRLAGHEVRTAHDGPAGIAAAEAHRPEVILLDIGLPGLTGHQVAARLRERPEFRATFLAAMTGYGQEEDRQRSKQAGFDRHLVKPVDPAAVEELIAALGKG